LTIANVPESKAEKKEKSARAARPLRLRLNAYLRWAHIYTSMFSLLIVLFFAVTGITLNHPDWVFGGAEKRTEVNGTLPSGWQKGGKADWLTVVEYLRAKGGVRGAAGDYHEDSSGDSLSFRAPGYSVDAVIDPKTGAYTLNVDQQGILAVMNDFHKGRDAGGAWAWAIDLAGGFLAFIALTGLFLLLYLKKIRTAALLTMLGGSAIVVVLMKLAY